MLVCWFSLVFFTSIHGSVSPAEKTYWEDFYYTTQGSNWTVNTGWTVGDPCENKWFGLNCNSAGSTVTSMQVNPALSPKSTNINATEQYQTITLLVQLVKRLGI